MKAPATPRSKKVSPPSTDSVKSAATAVGKLGEESRGGKLHALEASDESAVAGETHQGELFDGEKANDKPQQGVGRQPPKNADISIGPRAAHRIIKLEVLRLANRFKQFRAIDVAAGVFPTREFKAALSASQRAIQKLCRDGLLIRYRSDSGATFYGMTKVGARWLADNGDPERGDELANATVSEVGAKKNPEHDMWSNFLVLACKARGMTAWNEKEVIGMLNWTMEKRTFPLAFETGRRVWVRRDGGQERVQERVMKGLLPDALATSKGVIWIEIDRSARGDERREALANLIRNIGRDVKGFDVRLPDKTLRRVVVFCKHEVNLRRNISFLTGTHQSGSHAGDLRLSTLSDRGELKPILVETSPGCFEVRRFLPKAGSKHRVYERVGHLNIQLLPIWLPKYSYRGESRADGWFSENYLPFKREVHNNVWGEPESPLPF